VTTDGERDTTMGGEGGAATGGGGGAAAGGGDEVFTLPHVFCASPHGLAQSPTESKIVHMESESVRTDWPGSNLAWAPM
jgi:hypothetical protein